MRRYLINKSQQNRSNIIFISTSIRDSFNKAYIAADLSIKEELRKALKISSSLNEKLEAIGGNENDQPSEEVMRIMEEQGSNYWVIHENEDTLLALSEMKIIFFYKTVEIAIKDMMTIAFPKINKRDLFRWDFVMAYLKLNDIDIKNISGYSETNSLRIVNNNIKHSTELDLEAKKTPFWENKTEFTAIDLGHYFNLIEAKVMEFVEGFGKTIVNELYEFDEAKLEKMAKDIVDKLSKEQTEKLIEKIKVNL